MNESFQDVIQFTSLNESLFSGGKRAMTSSFCSVLQRWPSSAAVAGFQEIQTSFFLRCKELSLRLLRVMALGLGLDPDVFLAAHRFIGSESGSPAGGAPVTVLLTRCLLQLMTTARR